MSQDHQSGATEPSKPKAPRPTQLDRTGQNTRRRLHRPNTKISDSHRIILAEKLLRRGARTKTVEVLLGFHASDIRDFYREIFGQSPKKGPAPHSHQYFLSTPPMALSSALAWASRKAFAPQGYPLSIESVIEAYDAYAQQIDSLQGGAEAEAVKELPNGKQMPRHTFENFYRLIRLVGNLIEEANCNSCGASYLAEARSASMFCPCCTMHKSFTQLTRLASQRTSSQRTTRQRATGT